MRLVDLTGNRFGRYVVLRKAPSRRKETRWECQCDCGTIKDVNAKHLCRKLVVSCGCWKAQNASALMTRHGECGSSEYKIWCGIVNRCGNPNSTDYHNYGGRGVKLCEAWKAFPGFFADMGRRPTDAHSIDRIDVNGNYEPSNCRWADIETQANNKRACRFLTYKGETKTIAQWSRQLGIHSGSIRNRIVELGWSVEDALGKPARKMKPWGKRLRELV